MDHSDDDVLDDWDDYSDGDSDIGDDSVLLDADDEGDRLSSRKQSYTILSEADIQGIQEEATTEVSNSLSVSRDHACTILCHYKWNVGRAQDEWFADEANVRKMVGLPESPAEDACDATAILCRICLEMHSGKDMSAAACGHKFCCDCWRGYISTSINDGPGCLVLRCPDPSCAASVGPAMVSSHDNQKYAWYLLRSYVEGKKNVKWCPAPGCEFAVSFDGTSTNCDVCCKCGHGFCWNCAEEAHRPVDCETVRKWMGKNSAESENLNWILANSKPCPKCKSAIEKNQGCMHMTCRPPCRHEFCWLCLGPWSLHKDNYSCNRFAEAMKNEEFNQEERRRRRARAYAERYAHYWERWAANQKSMRKALADLKDMQAEKLEVLSAILGLPVTELQFVVEAWEQIVECRRVLTWTYAYGYYIPENELARQTLFVCLQGEAEAGLERLHSCAEMELKVYFDADQETVSEIPGEFIEYRSKLARLTSVTRNYFENLIRALENGLQEAQEDSQTVINYDDEGEDPFWSCDRCTFVNDKFMEACEICERPRYVEL